MAEPFHPTPAVFVVTRAGGAGLTRRQTQGRQFSSPTRGVRVRQDAPDGTESTTTALVAARPDTVLTDVSAAGWWQLPLPPWLINGPERVSLSVPAGEAHSRRRGVRGRRLDLPSEHVTTLKGLSVTTPARTWLDCAAAIPEGYLVAMGDAIVRMRLAPLDELRRMCHWGYRRRGVASARRALPLIDPRAESPGESLARHILVAGGVPRPVCNADIVWQGGWLARVDMLWAAERVIVEYDGIVHLTEDQRRRDAARRNLLQQAGYYLIVFTARDLRHPEAMITLVQLVLRERSTR